MMNKNRENGSMEWGLTALGKAGHTCIELHEALSPAHNTWEICVEMRSVQLRCTIPTPDYVEKIVTFLKNNYGKTKSRSAKHGEYPNTPEGTILYSIVDEIEISDHQSTYIRLCKDGEVPDRFIFSLNSSPYHVSYDIHHPETEELIQAFEDLKEDLGTT